MNFLKIWLIILQPKLNEFNVKFLSKVQLNFTKKINISIIKNVTDPIFL